MTQNLLNTIYEYYSSGELNNIYHTEIPEVTAFVKEYINPELQREQKAGLKIEAMFNAALAESARMEFVNGFKSCICLLIECFS